MYYLEHTLLSILDLSLSRSQSFMHLLLSGLTDDGTLTIMMDTTTKASYTSR